MNKIYFFILISITLCFGCENKQVQKEKVEVAKYKKYYKNSFGMKFVYIRPGTFE
jgi:hypothetical protein